jgi:hypothetical protein
MRRSPVLRIPVQLGFPGCHPQTYIMNEKVVAWRRIEKVKMAAPKQIIK